jgi:hypothetical protein
MALVKLTHIPVFLGVAMSAFFTQWAGAQEVLPRPEQPFRGHIGLTVQDSVPDFPKEIAAPKGGTKHSRNSDRRRWFRRDLAVRRPDSDHHV